MKRKRFNFYITAVFAVAAALCLFAPPALAADDGTTGLTITHRMTLLVVQLGVILFAAKLGNVLLEQIKMPGVLGELLVGMIIGPYLAGSIPVPGFPQGLFPLEGTFPVSPELYGVCAIASVVLLFMVGLETDIGLLLKYSLVGSLVGIGGVVSSFVLGDFMAILFSDVIFSQKLTFFSPASIFLGLVSTATSVGITARILSDKKKLDSPEGVTILTGAVVDDVLGIVLLAVGLGVITATGGTGAGAINWAHIGAIAAKAVGIWLAATAVGLLASRRISLLLKLFQDQSSIAMMALGLALILAGLFEEAGLAMVVGAYVMGLSLSNTDIRYVIRENLYPIFAFLVPIFFVVMGMLVDLHVLFSTKVLLFGVFYTIAVNAGKILGCGIPAMFCNFNLRGAARIGFGMLPRGEIALIIGGIGLAAGVLTPEVFGVIVLMILVTVLIAPPAIVLLFSSNASGLRRPHANGDIDTITFSFPSFQTAELLVGKLMAVFESEGFFVHLINRRKRIYQLRKDRVVIGFCHRNKDIDFNCGKNDVALVSAAMYEVVAELEQTIKELKRPVNAGDIVRRLQDGDGSEVRLTPLARYISPEVVEPYLKATTKEGVIDELLEILRKTGAIKDMASARKAVLAREASMSTGMQYGIAIPHARTNAVTDLVCAVGIKREGVDFHAIDSEKSKIIVLTLAPQGAPAPHVQFMATVSRALDANGRKRALDAETKEQLWRILASQGSPS
ncbi:MAG: cation:proton antiporter [Lentisphaerae bacterium]|nr:cation:proton antiporter [Lentisphaerota bacterium]